MNPQSKKQKYLASLSPLPRRQAVQWPRALRDRYHAVVGWLSNIRVTDFRQRERNVLRENAVFIDQLDLLLQMNFVVMARIR